VYIPDVQRVQSAAKHLLALINNMLDLSKIEAGKMELYLEEFALAEVVDEAVTAVLPLLERGGNPLRPQLPAELGLCPPRPDEGPSGAAEPARQRGEVHGGGRIELAVWREVRGGEEARSTWCCGSRTPASACRRSRSSASSRSSPRAAPRRPGRYGGTGLGLAITRSFCQRMRGDIEVGQQPRRGLDVHRSPAGGAAIGPEHVFTGHRP
jgi:signal transduction histidine kinase